MKPTKDLPKRHHHPIITKKLKPQIHRRDIYSDVTEDPSDAKSPTTPSYLPFIDEKRVITRSRTVLKRQMKGLIWEGETAIPVIIIPGSENDMIRAEGRGISRQDTDMRMLIDAQLSDWNRGSIKSHFSESFPQEEVLSKDIVKPLKLSLPL